MSLNIPPKKERTKKPEHKIRTGFTNEERDEWDKYILEHDISQVKLVRRALLHIIGRPVNDIVEGDKK